MAKLLGEKEYSILFHEGQRDNIHISIIGQRVILVVIFDQRSSLGLVRLRVDPESAWTTGLDQPQGSFFRIRFAESQPVARVSMLTTALGHFPMRFKLRVRTSSLDSDWVDLPFDLTHSYDDFFRALLHRPRAATLDLDLDGRSLAALQVKITDDDSFQMPWSMAELRVYRAAGSSSMGQGR